MLEIGIARIFSVMFAYHYAFLILSLALLGLGLGGIHVHLMVRNIPRDLQGTVPNLLLSSSEMMAISILGMTIMLVKVSVFQNVFLALVLASIPFFAAGIFISEVFWLYPARSTGIYAADLIGASAGSLLVLLLFKIGGINTGLLIAVLGSVPALLFAVKSSHGLLRKMAPVSLTAVLINVSEIV